MGRQYKADTTKGSTSASQPSKPQSEATEQQQTDSPASTGYQATQDARAEQVKGSALAMAETGKAQLAALQQQTEAFTEAFAETASDILVSAQARAWQLTAQKTAEKLGAYSPVDVGKVFEAFRLDTSDVGSYLQSVGQPIALMEGKSTAGV
jgi:hypothetical protein